MRVMTLGLILSLAVAGPSWAQPIIIPLQPQAQREPPSPPPPSQVPVAPPSGQNTADPASQPAPSTTPGQAGDSAAPAGR